jgi:hypothetical protein
VNVALREIRLADVHAAGCHIAQQWPKASIRRNNVTTRRFVEECHFTVTDISQLFDFSPLMLRFAAYPRRMADGHRGVFLRIEYRDGGRL